MSEPQHVWWCPVNEEWHGYACDDGDHDDENWHDKGDPPDVEHHAVRPETFVTLTREREEAVKARDDVARTLVREALKVGSLTADLASARTALAEVAAKVDAVLDSWGYVDGPDTVREEVREAIDALAGEGGA